MILRVELSTMFDCILTLVFSGGNDLNQLV